MPQILKKFWQRKNKHTERSASQRVLENYELLEDVLLCLTPTDLRQLRAVSRFWNETTTDSKILNATWQMNDTRTREMRILLIGDGGTSKQTLIKRWTYDIYDEWYDPTDNFQRSKTKTIGYETWIIEMEHFHRHWYDPYDYSKGFSTYSLPIDCYAFVYSPSSRGTFNSLRALDQHLCTISQTQLACTGQEHRRASPVAVIEAKQDLSSELREVSTEEGKRLAGELNCPFYRVSAKTAYGCEEAFDGIVRDCRNAINARNPMPIIGLR